MKFIYYVVFFLLISPMAVLAADIENVSMIQLIAAPEKYNEKTIRVIGYMHLEFEGNALYLHREDFVRAIGRNSIWIDLTESQTKPSSNLNDSYVVVEGIFSSTRKGHFGAWPGSLQISKISSWVVNRSKRHPLKQ